MSLLQYQDIRHLPPQANPYTDFRPSGTKRIIKGTLEYTIFATAISYGYTFNGFSIHSYYLETIGRLARQGPWRRTSTLAGLVAKFAALIGEVDTKEVVFGVLDQWEGKDGVDVGGNNKAYLHNITSGLVCFPIALALWRGQAMPAVRTAMLLCVFSQANDLIIESRRKRIFDSKYSSEQLKKREVQQHVAKVEADLKEVLQDPTLALQDRAKLKQIDLGKVEQWVGDLQFKTTQQEIEQARKKQLDLAFGFLHHWNQKTQ